MKNKVIGLFGLTFNSGNLGCQALSYSFCHILQSLAQNKKINAYVFIEEAGEYKELEIANGKIQFVPIQYSGKNIKSLFNLKKYICRCHLIFDFTGGDSFSDLYGTKRFIRVSMTKILTIICRRPLILGPQTYGPYRSRLAEKCVKFIIKKSAYACSRDGFSSKLINQISGKKLDVYTDMAFCLPYQKMELEGKKKKAGINVSGLLWRGGYTGNNQFGLKTDYKKYITVLIKKLCFLGYEIHLIPHVITKNYDNPENDASANDELKKMFPWVICPVNFDNPMAAKNYIAAMDVFIGARMHAAIGAFSSGVATIPFSYSPKFEGLYHSLGYPYLIHGLEYDTVTSLKKTEKYLENVNEIREAQNRSMTIAKKQIELFTRKVGELMEGGDE